MFMIDDQLKSTDKKSSDSPIFDDEYCNNSGDEGRQNEESCEAECDENSVETKELYLDELEQIDKLFEQIETEIAELALREGKETTEIETLLEEAAATL